MEALFETRLCSWIIIFVPSEFCLLFLVFVRFLIRSEISFRRDAKEALSNLFYFLKFSFSVNSECVWSELVLRERRRLPFWVFWIWSEQIWLAISIFTLVFIGWSQLAILKFKKKWQWPPSSSGQNFDMN